MDTTALVQSLSDGSAESAAILAGLSTATDAEIAEVVKSMQGAEAAKTTLSETMGELEADYAAKMAEVVADTAKMVHEIDKSSEARTSGENTLQGYINGIDSKSWQLNTRNEIYSKQRNRHMAQRMGRAPPLASWKLRLKTT